MLPSECFSLHASICIIAIIGADCSIKIDLMPGIDG